MRRVFLAGEGTNELGGWALEEAHRDAAPDPGVLETLLRQVAPDGWEIAAAVPWKKIRKYRAGGRRGAETRNVLGAALMARESRCDVLVFSRDQDNRPDRTAAVTVGIDRVAVAFPDGPELVAGMAVECLEAWVLALRGEHRAETHSKAAAQRRLAEAGVAEKDTRAMTELARAADLRRLPADAVSLSQWLTRGRRVLASAST